MEANAKESSGNGNIANFSRARNSRGCGCLPKAGLIHHEKEIEREKICCFRFAMTLKNHKPLLEHNAKYRKITNMRHTHRSVFLSVPRS